MGILLNRSDSYTERNFRKSGIPRRETAGQGGGASAPGPSTGPVEPNIQKASRRTVADIFGALRTLQTVTGPPVAKPPNPGNHVRECPPGPPIG